MQAIFEIVGAEDFSDIVVAGGLKVSRNDIDSPKTGRSKMNAKMHRKRLAIKRKLSVTCLRMNNARMAALADALMPETIKVRFIDPYSGGVAVEKEFYGSSVESTTLVTIGDDVYWDGTTFNLIEV